MDIMKRQPKIRFTPKTSPGRFMHLSEKKRIMTCHHVYNAHLSKKIHTHHASLTSFSPGGLDFKNRGTKASKTEDASLVLMPRFDPNEMGEGFDGQPEGLDDELVCVCMFFFCCWGGEYISCNIDWLYVNIPYGKRWLSNKNGPENALNQDDLRCMYHLQSRSLQNGIASVDWTKCFVPWRRACLAQQRMHLTSWAADLIKQKIHREPWQLRAWSGSGTPNESSMCCFKTMRMWYQCCTTEQQAWKN